VRFTTGRIWQDGKFWLVEVPVLNVMTQGLSREDALFMIKDAIESLVNREGYMVDIKERSDGTFEVHVDDDEPLIDLAVSCSSWT
jgi:predicted RNase H-like HicB family nuclease